MTSTNYFDTLIEVAEDCRPKAEWPAERERFFSKGQPCFRASPLTKRYGWGVHSDAEGKVALVGCSSAEYLEFIADDSVVKKKAMRSKRA